MHTGDFSEAFSLLATRKLTAGKTAIKQFYVTEKRVFVIYC